MDAEHIGRHLQFDAARHGFEQRIELRLHFVDIRRRVAEIKTLHRNRLRSKRHAAQRIGLTAVGEQLPVVKQRQDAVEFPVRIGLAGRIVPHDLAIVEINRRETLRHATV